MRAEPMTSSNEREVSRARLDAIDWSEVTTAYGDASVVPSWLFDFVHADLDAAERAGGQLWAALCHQHAYVSSAALPALPWILEALRRTEEELVVEALDILLGFVVCTDDTDEAASPWKRELREGVRAAIPVLRPLVSSECEDIAYFAGRILEELGASYT